MVNIYDSLRDENGIRIQGRTKLFVGKTLEDGSLFEPISGIAFSTEENGSQFIVDNWLIDQLDKVVLRDGTLQVKQGEQLDEPVKSEKEKQREILLWQLALLDADNEEQTDEPE